MSGFRVAIGGKGGVGKTTVCGVLAQLLAKSGLDVLAIDADPDTNLAAALGATPDQVPESIINMKKLISERTGTDRNATGADFRMNPEVGDIPEKYWVEINGLKLFVLGGITRAGAGCACAEGSFLKALLTHTMLHRKEALIVDLEAGVECMGRSSIEGIDVLIVVVEPGSRSIETALNISQMAKWLNIKQVAAIINKVTDDSQIEQIRLQLGTIPVLTSIRYTPEIQQADMSRSNVIESTPIIVEKLTEAKDALMEMVKESD